MLQSRLHRYIESVARHGSIRKAAETLNVAPSAVNRQILEYERSLGLALFDRLPRGLSLTSAGETILAYIRQADRDHALMMARLRDLAGQQAGRITLVAAPGLVSTLIPRVAAPFCAQRPLVDLAVDALQLPEVVEAVAEGDADLGLGFDIPRDPRLTTLASVRQSLGFVTRPDHPLAGRATVRLSDCVGLPLILPHHDAAIRQILEVAFAEQRIDPRVILSSNSVDLRKQMVIGGAGITVLSRVNVMEEVAAGRLCHLRIVDASLPGQTLKLVARAKGALEPLQSRFAEHLRQAVAELPA